MEKAAYLRNDIGGPLFHTLWMELAKGQGSLQGNMGVTPVPLLEAQI